MKKTTLLACASVLILVSLLAWGGLAARLSTAPFESTPHVDRRPVIRPDYSDTIIPPNIAPLNFLVAEPGVECAVRISAEHGDSITVRAKGGKVAFPSGSWRRLLAAGRGGKMTIDVCLRTEEGGWKRFQPIVNTIAEDEIDPYVYYRLIHPLHTVYSDVNIYQRDIRCFNEFPLALNRSFGDACVNCHTPAPNHPDRMVLQTRGVRKGRNYGGTFVIRDGEARKVDTRRLVRPGETDHGRLPKAMAGYSAWHPNGEIVAFSANDIHQFMHAVGDVRDVGDSESDLGLYHVEEDRLSTCPAISAPDRLETFPTWSPDGRTLYFCSTAPWAPEDYAQVRYDLMRIGYDPESETWGELETVLSSETTGLSITEPRVSPDGKRVLVCMSDYGSFPVYQRSSDLYLIDLPSGEYHRLEINSPRSESWHCWSSNGRWIAFASKRGNGLFGRIYFSYVDEAGQAHKPVLLPQEDPTFYDRSIRTYNAPELAVAPAPITSRTLGRTIRESSVPATENDHQMRMHP